MTQKLVTFEVAKALKEAGYPQEKLTTKVYLVNCDKEGKLAHYTSALYYDCVVAPTYIDAWLWLWRGKEIRICLEDAWDLQEPEIERGCYVGTNQLGGICSSKEFADPEDAIVDIIDYLVENDLIK